MRNLIGAMLLSAMTVATASAQSGFTVQQDKDILGSLKAAPIVCGIDTDDLRQKWVRFQLTAIHMRRGWNGDQMNRFGWLAARPIVDPYPYMTPAQKRQFEPARRRFCGMILNMRKTTRNITG